MGDVNTAVLIVTVSGNEGKLRSYSNFFRRLIKIFLPRDCLPNESKMETMGAVIQQSFVMERAQAPGLSGLCFLLPPGFLGRFSPAGSGPGKQVWVRQFSIEHFPAEMPNSEGTTTICVAFPLGISRTAPGSKLAGRCSSRRGRGAFPLPQLRFWGSLGRGPPAPPRQPRTGSGQEGKLRLIECCGGGERVAEPPNSICCPARIGNFSARPRRASPSRGVTPVPWGSPMEPSGGVPLCPLPLGVRGWGSAPKALPKSPRGHPRRPPPPPEPPRVPRLLYSRSPR